jgi:amino acid adenylation domain-containing protein
MTTFDHDTDIGLALLAEQQAWVQRAQDGVTWGEGGHFIQLVTDGQPDLQRLQTALDLCLQRHPGLRTTLRPVAGYHGLRQFAGTGPTRWPLTLHERGDAAHQLQQWFARPLLVVADGVYFDALLQQPQPGQWRLTLGVARLLADQTSLTILVDALIQAYAQDASLTDEAPAEFAQYLQWRSEVVVDEDAPTAREYWQAQANTHEAVVPDLPERRLSSPSSSPGQSCSATLDAAMLNTLSSFAQPLEAVLQAAWWLLLARISGRERYVGGWRHDARRDYEFFAHTPGLLEKTLPLGIAPAMDQPFASWLDALATRLEEHAVWQEYCPETAHGQLTYGFALRTGGRRHNAGGLHWQAMEVADPASVFEVVLNVLLEEGAVALRLDYQPGRHGAGAMQRLLTHYQVLLQSLVATPDASIAELNLLSATERAQWLALNPQPVDFSANGLLPALIARWAERTPQAVALEHAGQRLSYADLHVQVAQVASVLAAEGVSPGEVVAIALPRSAAQVVCMLACWHLGAAYLPLDPGWPLARRQLVVQQAQAKLLLSDGQSFEHDVSTLKVVSFDQALLRSAQTVPAAAVQLRGHDAAYVLFTSGSTGVPKGVVIGHQAVLNYTAGVTRTLQLDGCRHFAFGSSVAADLGNTTLFAALYTGATLHIADDATMQDPGRFAGFIQTQAIDCLKIVPSHLSALLDTPQPQLPATLILGGEALAPGLVRRVLGIRPDCRLFNHYGPTESTVGVLVHPLGHGDSEQASIPLSQVLPNNQVFVLDARQRLVASGEPGELYIGGQQLAQGYLGAAAGVSTAQAFIAHPFSPGERLYRSGDLARYRADGSLQLYGRRDQQVKVRGFRIELAEIEGALLQLPEVSEAVVLLDQTLAQPVAFVVMAQHAAGDAFNALKAHLALQLPVAMLPARIERVLAMPRLGNGKVDRQALQALTPAAPQQLHVAPRNALEQLIASRMAQLLGQETLSVEQDFFAAGGHSLLVIKLVAGVRKLLQCEVQPGVVFDHPTPAALAQALQGLESHPGQLEKIARARLQMDAMSPEEKARLLEAARQGA